MAATLVDRPSENPDDQWADSRCTGRRRTPTTLGRGCAARVTRTTATKESVCNAQLGLGTAAVLAAIDLIYAPAGRISKVYLLDDQDGELVGRSIEQRRGNTILIGRSIEDAVQQADQQQAATGAGRNTASSGRTRRPRTR